jgi:uncharacterized protein (TIGR02118 family)
MPAHSMPIISTRISRSQKGLHFDDVAAIQKAFASPEGQAAAADVQSFATGGVDMFIFDNTEV